MSRFYNYPEAESLQSDDVFLIDGETDGTRKIPADKMADFFGEQVPTDKTLAVSNMAADAKVVGDEIGEIKSAISEIEPGLSNTAKVALLNCFQHVVWVDAQGQTYYDALEDALYADSYPKITAQFNSGLNVIYTDDTLDSLKQYLTVTYYETEEGEGTVVPSANYTLSGTLTEGTSAISVMYDDLWTSFTINGVVDFYNQHSVITTLASTGNIFKNGSLNVIMSDTSTLTRATIGLSKGRQPIYKKTPYEGLFYPIPIPIGAVRVTVECASTLKSNIASWQWDGSNYGDKILDTGWLPDGGGSATFESIENGFVTVLFKKSDSSNFTNADLPVNVSITFE